MTDSHWDLDRILQITDPQTGIITCVAHAESTNARCRIPISHGNQAHARSILTQLSRAIERMTADRLKDWFDSPAYLLLCSNDTHAQQARNVAQGWYRRIMNVFNHRRTNERIQSPAYNSLLRHWSTANSASTPVPASSARLLHETSPSRTANSVVDIEHTARNYSSAELSLYRVQGRSHVEDVDPPVSLARKFRRTLLAPVASWSSTRRNEEQTSSIFRFGQLRTGRYHQSTLFNLGPSTLAKDGGESETLLDAAQAQPRSAAQSATPNGATDQSRLVANSNVVGASVTESFDFNNSRRPLGDSTTQQAATVNGSTNPFHHTDEPLIGLHYTPETDDKPALWPGTAFPVFNSLDDDDDDGDGDPVKTNECPICYYPMTATYRTPCGHVFCPPCITKWLRKRDNRVCPVDRKKLKKKDLVLEGPPALSTLSRKGRSFTY